MMDAPRIGFVGAGQMGLPMVRRLLAAGCAVTVFARREDARRTCTALGAEATDTVAGAVRSAGVVIACLFSDDQLTDVALGPDGLVEAMAPGALLISHTTGSPATVRAIAERGAARGVRVVDAPVSGSAQDIDDGRVTVMLGGDPADVEEALTVTAAYGDPILPIGPLGSAQFVKLLNNALFAAQIQLAGEVARVAGELGVDMGRVANAVQRSSGSSYAMGLVETMGSLDALVEGAGPFLAKDVAVIRQVADELRIDLGVLAHVNEHGPLTFAPRI